MSGITPRKSSFTRNAGGGREVTKSGPAKISKHIPGKVLSGKRVVIEDPGSTTLWPENPRNFDYDKDLSDLVPLIIEAGSNSTPVDARMLKDGTIEVIAGSRRRASCMSANKPLVADVWEDLTDDDARRIAETENEGRKEITELGMCSYYANQLARLKELHGKYGVEQLAEKHRVKKSMMYERIAIGNLPDEVRALAETDIPWSVNDLINLKALYKELGARGDVSESQFCDVGKSAKLEGATPKDILTALSKTLKPKEPDKPKLDVEELTVGSGKAICKVSRTGATSIQLSRGVPKELKDKIMELIKSFE